MSGLVPNAEGWCMSKDGRRTPVFMPGAQPHPSRRVDVQLCRLRAKTGLDLFRNVRDRGWALRPVA